MTTSLMCLSAALLIAFAPLPAAAGGGQAVLPAAVNKPTLTYVASLKASILFGGYPRSGSPLGETWSLKSGRWTHLDIAGPPPRGGHGAAYDASRGRLVVFGGAGAGGAPLADTWEFDGSAWEQKAVHGPSARMLHRMAFDSERGRVVLFGGTASGRQGPHFDETWEWDGAVWTRLDTKGPAPRFESAMAYDSTRNALVVFGGASGAGKLADTWTLAGGACRAAAGPGPSKRDHHGMAFHEARGVVVMQGGWSGERMLGDTWLWDGARWTEHAQPGPSTRGGVPAMTYDSDRRKVLLYGGWGEDGPLQDLWEWDGEWTAVLTVRERPRYHAGFQVISLLSTSYTDSSGVHCD